ncbi:MAG TPA: glycosyltransferase family 4 protein [Gemmatimonadales bacterium]|nr:glycosyltransferase family 4 protein [Gemmatimonadales bacterium]
MRILLVNWNDRENPQAGGAEVHLHEIFGRLARRGHAIDLVTSGWAGGAPEAQLDGMRVERHGGRYSFAVQARGVVRRLLGAHRYDIVVEDINKLPLYLAGLTDRPFCAVVPHLFGTTAFLEASWPVAAVVWAAERLVPRAYRRAWFHAISDSTRDDLVRRGVPADRIEVVYPGVDATWYAPDPTVRRTLEPTFLYVGRLKRYKGVEIALEALALVRQARADVTLDIAGQGDDRPRLEGVARALGLGAAARFVGFVSDEEKRRLLRRSWAVLLPSPKEGWGISNVEAAACGTPALVSDSPGLRESVRHGETGFLVPHGDTRVLADRMLTLAADPALVGRLGRAGRAFAERLSWERAAAATEAQLLRILAQGG